MHIKYDPIQGETVPDGQVESLFKNWAQDPKIVRCTGQWNMLTRARLGLLRGEIDTLCVTYFGVTQTIDNRTASFTQLVDEPGWRWHYEIARLGIRNRQQDIDTTNTHDDATEHDTTCVLTGADGENPDDCTTHDHD